ncbi:caspase-1-like [Neolamprologus brichardi]|uniref:caspase-1-like n=1 Tax=Neolamprologus brichardi TaxID=32507 RepID=UPI001643746B|nr:caspase-1-like [Neolamprologus brichardi]
MTRNIQATNMPRRTKRVALLINNMHFYDPALTRHGADKDEQAVVNLLHTLGYEVDRHRNLPAQKMDEALKWFSRRPTLPLTDSVFVVVMSHGGMGTICGTGNHRMEVDRIYERLNSRNCPALKDKPKIVIIQASRGVLVPGRLAVPTDKTRAQSVNQAAPLHAEKDFITLYCSAPHMAAYQHPAYGSFFIQSIAEVFSSRCVQDPIDELFKKVMQRFRVSGMQQLMPSVKLHTLTKPFYLLPGNVQVPTRPVDRRGRPDALR